MWWHHKFLSHFVQQDTIVGTLLKFLKYWSYSNVNVNCIQTGVRSHVFENSYHSSCFWSISFLTIHLRMYGRAFPRCTDETPKSRNWTPKNCPIRASFFWINYKDIIENGKQWLLTTGTTLTGRYKIIECCGPRWLMNVSTWSFWWGFPFRYDDWFPNFVSLLQTTYQPFFKGN